MDVDVVGGAGQGAALGTMITPGLGTAIGGALGALSGIFGSSSASKANQANIDMQRETNMINIAEAAKNRDFQERMSSSAHQREIADLYAAGLNPILSARYGGSSTPSGSMATAVAPVSKPVSVMGSMFQGMSEGAREGLGSAREANQMEIDWKMTQQRLTNMQEDLVNAVKTGSILYNVGEKTGYEAATAKAESIIRTVESIWQKNYGFEVRQEELNKLKEQIKNIEADTSFVTERQKQEKITAAIMNAPFYREFMGHIVQSAPGINAAANVGGKFTDLIPWNKFFKK